jgi:hypothetical protein
MLERFDSGNALGQVRWWATVGFFAISFSPARAGGWEDMPWWGLLGIYSIILFLVGLPAIGLGFFLRGLMRLRNAMIVLISLFLILPIWVLVTRGLERTWEFVPLLALMLSVLGPLVGLGWYVGIWDTKRHLSRRTLALNNGN